MLKKIIAASAAILLLSIHIFAQGATPPSISATWSYLDSQPPGPRSALAYSLSGKPIRPEVSERLSKQFLTWQDSDLPSVVEYENAVLSLIKLGGNPTDYKGRNLLSAFYPTNALEVDGLDGVSGALLVYSASGQEITQSQPNSPNALLDRIISAQQSCGGFALRAGQAPDVSVTARVITALYPYCSPGSDISAVVQKSLEWMCSQQNADGTFSVKGLPSGNATAQVLLAASLYQPHFQAFTVEHDLLGALEAFRNPDGGYSEILGGESSTKVTEMALIAYHVAQTCRFPYYAPTSGRATNLSAEISSSPTKENSTSTLSKYFKFLASFAFIFLIVYLLLMITIKIGKFAEKKKLPGSLAAQTEKNAENAELPQMHIPMQAAIPDFDDCTTQELEIGHPQDESSNNHIT